VSADSPSLDLAATFAGRRILFVGSTGFVGKVALSLLLRRYPGVGKVFVLVRPGAGSSAEDRFFRKVAGSPVFDPLREVWGAGFDAFLREKVVPLPGDIARPLLNFSDEDLARLDPLDVVVNCAGLVSFDPSLETALRINTYGVRNVIAVAKRTHAALVHVSTCFVAGNRDGEVWEDEPVTGYFPRAEELLDGSRSAVAANNDGFSVEGEIEDCERLIEQVRQRADDRAHLSMFRERAAERLRAEGRDADNESTLKIAVQRERKVWVAEQLTALGMERAQHWGWPNTYTYTKSLGDQLCARAEAEHGVRCCLVRPSIVESAVRYPFAGWNEGFTTSAPLALLVLMGHRQFPMSEKNVLDIVPVDLVGAGLVAATGATIAGTNRLVYHLASGDANPLYGTRALGLLGLYKRRYFQQRETGPKWLNRIKSRLEPIPVDKQRWSRASAPMWKGLADGLIRALDERVPRWGAPRLQAMAEHAREKLEQVSSLTGQTVDLFEMFMPFIYDRNYVFRCDQTRALFRSLTDADRMALAWNPEAIDWRRYWLDVHMPGLEKWVFPSLEEEFRAKPRAVYTYKDLLELFDTVTKHHRQRTAMRQLPPVEAGGAIASWKGEPKRYTYGDLQELANRAAAVLRERGVVAGDRVMLLSENRPEWGITYFGVLKAGAAVVPVDANATGEEVLNLLRSARARAAVISDKAMARLLSEHSLNKEALGVQRLGFDDLFEREPLVSPAALVHKPKGDDLASLIFTSGTTGRPKGVMLSHRNFSSLLSKLAGIFDVDRHDGLLSVLPLHHTFEFTAGLLMPLMRGAQIAYPDELTADALTAAFAEGNVTGMVGVPALWQLLHRRVMKPVAERGPIAERAFALAVELNRKLRDQAPPSLAWLADLFGRLLFFPVHARFGGRLRLLISGGSALPVEVMKVFRGLGFGLYEGYGLTEAAPVLTVTRPGAKLLPGSVGEPLPGIEVRIDEPDASGVGEVIASGPNVMMGYYEDPDATAATLEGGWLRTGDLGRFDEKNRLYIVGRKKEMILGASGENVYPDELEELYRNSSHVKELSIAGLPADNGELVACLAVPDYEAGDGLGREEVRERIREHVHAVSVKLPLYKRIKVLHFTDVELPKTATRKVKRKLVVEELQKLERVKHLARRTPPDEDVHARSKAAAGGAADDAGWLREVLAAVTGRPAEQVTPSARLEELGFDSLMYTELGVALEAAGVAVPESVELGSIATVEELQRLVASWGRSARRRPEPKRAERDDGDEIPVPRLVAELGSRGLDYAQKLTYERVFETRVTGRAYLPRSSRFIVAANHTSHLDMGLVKHALGEWGPKLVALAAKDYFFEDPVKRAYFENFTSLVPMERHGSLRESLRLAEEVIAQGYILLIFPEGTRSETGVMAEFKASIGYLSLRSGVDVLPMYLEGTHDAMPKGALWPRQRRIAAHIGPLLTVASLRQAVASLPRGEHYREAARLVEVAVRRLAPPGPDRRAPPPGGALVDRT
jgi:long-chain acyl-CoA synthetase